ncbi:MAG TPA: alpha/beta hydrolase [Steroidobacteraceae bacterium]|nr:alpha/beta hydrolase [Steroidobacteraceae bacterium]
MSSSNTNSQFLNNEYNPRATIPDFAATFSRWQTAASEARARLQGRLNLPYGESPAETLDFFPAPQTRSPLLIFLHGGYWRALDKSDFSWIAPPYVAAGVAVAIVNYALLPSTPLAGIVNQTRRACAWLYRNGARLGLDTRRFLCAGHSAGGHLTAMMLATDWPAISADLPRRLLSAGLTISGLFDLTPLTPAEFLRHDLQLNEQQARELSPAFLQCHNDAPLIRAIGALETAEFHRQSILMEQHWPHACTRALIEVPGTHHLSVCDELARANGPLWAVVQSTLS